MSTTNDKKEKETPIEEPPEWGKWGDGKTKPEMKEFFELTLSFFLQESSHVNTLCLHIRFHH